MSSTIKIIALCASHIDSTERLERFVKMLVSWKAQSSPCDLVVSLSFDDSLSAIVNRVIRTLHHPGLTFNIRTSRLRQFEHYTTLADSLRMEDVSWVIFTDDDDVWHKNRVRLTTEAISQILAIPRDPTQKPLSCIRLAYDGQQSAEYVDCVCPVVVFKRFFEILPKSLRSFDYCDLLLANFLQHNRNYGSAIAKVNVQLYDYDDSKSYPRITNQKSSEPFTSEVIRKAIFRNASIFLARDPSATRERIWRHVQYTINCLPDDTVKVQTYIRKYVDIYFATESCKTLKEAGLKLVLI